MNLKVYNTLSRTLETFKPLREGSVGIYVCGPTVYGDSHVGHAKSYVSFDVIVRYLRHIGFNVLYVQNITDVGHLTDDADDGEDKIETQAKKERLQPMTVAERYMRSYYDDMDKINNIRPDISPRAAGHIIEQIEMIKVLLEKGYAYETNGSVYFDVRKFHEYGKLSGRALDEMVSGVRIESKSEKRYPADFALWKSAEPQHIMKWPSPWGMGYPGWHIECSAMSIKYLGDEFDIHGGGIENQFPHHECEIAQSVTATGKSFAKYWLHNNMVTVDGTKMGKSLGNVITLKSAYKTYNPLVIRFFILQSHYRSPLDFSNDALDSAKRGYERLFNSLRLLRLHIEKGRNGEQIPVEVADYRNKFYELMNNDFDTPRTIALLFDLSHEINHYLNDGEAYSSDSLKRVEEIYTEFGRDILGLFPEVLDYSSQLNGETDSNLMEIILEIRKAVREQKMYDIADMIRSRLKEAGILVEDTPDGPVWRRIE